MYLVFISVMDFNYPMNFFIKSFFFVLFKKSHYFESQKNINYFKASYLKINFLSNFNLSYELNELTLPMNCIY